MKKYLVIVAAAALFAVGSCGNESADKILDAAASLIAENPSEALELLDSLAETGVNGRTREARLSQLRSVALDKNAVDTADISVILPAFRYYERHGDELDKARTYFYYGRVLQNGGDDDAALEAFSAADLYADRTDDIYLKGLIADCLADIYDDNEEFGTAMEFYDEALGFFEEIGNIRNEMYVLDDMSRTCLCLEDYGEAVSYAEKAVNKAVMLNDTSEILSMTVSLSDAYLFEGYSESAYEIIRQVSDRYCGGEVPSTFAATLCQIYLASGNIPEARRCAETLSASYEGRDVNPGAYGLLFSVEQAAGNYEKACEYLIGFIDALDRENELVMKESVYEADMRYKNAELVGMIEKRDRHIRNILLVSFLSFAALSGFMVSVVQIKKRRLQEKDSEIVEYRNRIIAIQDYCEKLESVRRISPSRESMIVEQVSVLKELMAILVRFQGTMKASAYARFKELTVRDEARRPAMLEIFLRAFEAEFPGVTELLRGRYPDLTEKDIELYALIGLECSASVIAFMYDTSESYVYNCRLRLRRKLDLKDEKQAFNLHLSELSRACTDNRAA